MLFHKRAKKFGIIKKRMWSWLKFQLDMMYGLVDLLMTLIISQPVFLKVLNTQYKYQGVQSSDRFKLQ